MAPTLTATQYDLIYNCASLGLASMGASTAFFFLRVPSLHERYKTALCITGLVTFIAMYHYMRIFNSFEKAYTPCQKLDGVVNYNLCDADEYGYSPTGIPFNDAYRYVDWFLTVPMLLIEIILVMGLSAEETKQRCTTLGVSSALMIAFGYPGEITGEIAPRMLFWCISMVPFIYIVYTLFIGLKEAQEKQMPEIRDAVKWACYATVFSWCTYPIVYLFPVFSGNTDGKAGLTAGAMTAVQIGYTVSDVISKCGVGFLVYRIGLAKSTAASNDHDAQMEGIKLTTGEASNLA
jgi:bacteriorhodopsin